MTPLDLGLVLENVSDALVVVDRNWLCVFANAAFEHLAGCHRQDILGRNYWDLAAGAIGTAFDRQFHESMSQGTPVEFEAFYPPLGLWLAVRTLPCPQGLVLLFRDISARQQAEEAANALRLSEWRNREVAAEREHWQRMIEGIAEEVWSCDAQGRMSLVNLAALTAMGLEGFKDKTVHEVVEVVDILYCDGTLRPPEQAPLLRSLRGEMVRGEEIMHHRTTGRTRWRQFSSAPTRDASGQITGAVAIVRDITAHKEAAELAARQSAVVAGIARIFREALTCENEEELGRMCLAVVEELTQSTLGFIAVINVQGDKLHDIAITHPEIYRWYDSSGHGTKSPLSSSIHGIIGQVLRDGQSLFTNDPPAHPDRIGTPPGHPPLTAFLGVPLTHAGKTIGMIGLANRAGGYGPEHQQAVEAVAPAIVEAFLHRRAHEALARSEQRLRLAQEAARAGTWEWDLQTNENIWSDELWSVYGLAPHSCRPSYAAWLRTVHPDDRDQAAGAVDAAAAAGTELRVQWRVCTEDGGERWVMARGQPQRDANGRVVRYLGIVMDVTEQKLAEQKLRASEAQLQMLAWQWRLALDAAGLGWWNYDPVTQRASWDKRYQEILGLAGEEAPIAAVLAHLHPDDLPRVWAAVEAALNPRDSQPYAVEYRLVRDDGTVRWVEAHGMAVFDGQGTGRRARNLVGTIQDITERKLAEERLRESQQHFAALAGRNHRLAQELEHRVRNSIQGLLGLVAAMRGRTSDVRIFAKAMEGRLMALAHVQKMLAARQWQLIDLKDLVGSTVQMMEPLAPQVAKLAVEGPRVLIRPDQVMPLVLIFSEWFTNSCKYGAHTSPEGRLSITWSIAHPDGQSPSLRLQWMERGGPPVASPAAPSLGTELVDSFATRELHGRCMLSYPKEGVEHVLQMPLGG